MSIKIIDCDIALKGNAYVIIDEMNMDNCLYSLNKETDMLFSKGASTVCAKIATTDGNAPREGFQAGKYHFVPHCSIDLLKRDIHGNENGGLEMIPLTPGNSDEYIRIYNLTFKNVANASYMRSSDTEEAISDEKIVSGFFADRGRVIGIYELEYETEAPEISSLAVDPHFQGKGYGKRCLETIFERLYREGYKDVMLSVASTNERAYKLYLKNGFEFYKEFSYWYETELHE